MPGKFEIYKNKSGQFQFSLKSSDGRIILESDKYSSRAGAVRGIQTVRKNAALRDRFEPIEDKAAKPYFVLKAGNHQVIAQSSKFESVRAMENSMAVVMKTAPKAKLASSKERTLIAPSFPIESSRRKRIQEAVVQTCNVN